MNFLGLPQEHTLYDSSPVVIIPCPLEKTTTYRKGTAKGPEAIIEASHQVEFYDCELKRETWRPGIHTLPPLDFNGRDSKAAVQLIEKTLAQVLEAKKFPICLGGEHTLSAGAILACLKRYPKLSILQIDAHADLRESYEGTPYSHACAMRLIASRVSTLVGVGIRSVAEEEAVFAKENRHISLFYDHERPKEKNWIERVLGNLTQDVYLTIDIDGFDPGLIPATGTPEPGGLSWHEGLALIRACFQEKRVVGADLVELCPQPELHACDFTCAKLVYKIIGYLMQ